MNKTWDIREVKGYLTSILNKLMEIIDKELIKWRKRPFRVETAMPSAKVSPAASNLQFFDSI